MKGTVRIHARVDARIPVKDTARMIAVAPAVQTVPGAVTIRVRVGARIPVRGPVRIPAERDAKGHVSDPVLEAATVPVPDVISAARMGAVTVVSGAVKNSATGAVLRNAVPGAAVPARVHVLEIAMVHVQGIARARVLPPAWPIVQDPVCKSIVR